MTVPRSSSGTFRRKGFRRSKVQHNNQWKTGLPSVLIVCCSAVSAHSFFQTGPPLSLWGELVLYFGMQINCTPSSTINNKAPMHLSQSLILTDKHPSSYQRLKPFGCLAFAPNQTDHPRWHQYQTATSLLVYSQIPEPGVCGINTPRESLSSAMSSSKKMFSQQHNTHKLLLYLTHSHTL